VDVHHGPAGRDRAAKKAEIPVANSRQPWKSLLRLLQSLANAKDTATGQRGIPKDMVEVEGDYCPAPRTDLREFISEKRDRCERF